MVTVRSKFHITKTFNSWGEALDYYRSIEYCNGQRNAWIEIPIWHRIVINAHFRAMYDSGFPNWDGRIVTGKRYAIASKIRQKWSHIFELYGL